MFEFIKNLFKKKDVLPKKEITTEPDSLSISDYEKYSCVKTEFFCDIGKQTQDGSCDGTNLLCPQCKMCLHLKKVITPMVFKYGFTRNDHTLLKIVPATNSDTDKLPVNYKNKVCTGFEL